MNEWTLSISREMYDLIDEGHKTKELRIRGPLNAQLIKEMQRYCPGDVLTITSGTRWDIRTVITEPTMEKELRLLTPRELLELSGSPTVGVNDVIQFLRRFYRMDVHGKTMGLLASFRKKDLVT